jgi:hypothetical protein
MDQNSTEGHLRMPDTEGIQKKPEVVILQTFKLFSKCPIHIVAEDIVTECELFPPPQERKPSQSGKAFITDPECA